MNRIPSIRLVLVVTVLAALLTVPTANARGLESPSRVEAGWFGAAMRWLEGITGLRPAPRAGRSAEKGDPVVVASPEDPGDPLSGGSCVDPQGKPRPMCEIDG